MPSARASLLTPRTSLAGCLFAAVVRDTRGVDLPDADRFNHFPASPLVALSVVLEGALHLVRPDGAIEPLPRFSVAGPQTVPTVSWSPGPVLAVSVGIYPEAWTLLTGASPLDLSDRVTAEVPSPFGGLAGGGAAFWTAFQDGLAPHWQAARASGGIASWSGRDRLADWSRSLAVRAALSGPGQSLRAVERRIRSWSGQSRQMLDFYGRFETLHAASVSGDVAGLADIAQAAGYADQSHMGRAVRRATGCSPAELNRRIATEEAFWCYRLLGERF